jgi:tetratricopeptide (TPR) repeat protein
LPHILLASRGKDSSQNNSLSKNQHLRDAEDALVALTLGNIGHQDQRKIEEAKELLRKDKTIKIGRLFNFFFSKLNFWNELDIEDIALFQIGPTFTAGKKTVDLIRESQKVIAEWKDISIRERKALVKYETFLGKHPQSEYAPDIQRKLQKLKAKKRRHDYLREMKLAEQALEGEDFPLAKKHYQKAFKRSPASYEEVSGALEKSVKLEDAYIVRRKAINMVKPGGEIFNSPEEKGDYEKLLVSLTKHDANTLLPAGKEFLERHKDSPLKDEAEVSVALAYEFKNDLSRAQKVFKQVGENYPKSNMGMYARKIADNSHYDLYSSIKKTAKNRKKDAVKYVLLGENFNLGLPKGGITGWAKRAYGIKENQKEVSSPNRLLKRAFEVFVQKKIPTNKTILSLGEEYLRKNPHSRRANEVRKIIARTYEEEKRYNAALFHYNLISNIANSKLKELEDKAATGLLQDVREDEKDLYYANILELYPRSDAAHLIRKYANKKGSDDKGSKIKAIGFNFEIPASGPMLISLIGGNPWVIKAKNTRALSAYHPLLGLDMNFDNKSHTNLEKDIGPKFLGLSLYRKKEWVKEDKYSMGYQLWDEKQFAVGKMSLNKWGTTAQMGVNKKGANTRLHLPIPVINNFIPLALKVRARLGRIQFLPVMEDSQLEDAALYQD